MYQTLQTLSDQDLIALAKSGEQVAYDVLIERYEPEVRKIGCKYFLQRAEYDDLLQEGRIAIYRAVLAYDSDSTHLFDHFVRMCIKRRLIDTLRTHNRLKHSNLNNAYSLHSNLSDDNEHTFLDQMTSTSDPAQTVVDVQEARAIIKDLSHSLSKMEQQVFAYHFIAGYKQRELSKTLGIKPKALDNAIQRIKKKSMLFKQYHSNIC